MKIQKKDRRACAAKASALKRLLGRGMFLEGSLNMSMRGGSEHWQLTDKVDAMRELAATMQEKGKTDQASKFMGALRGALADVLADLEGGAA